MNRRRCVSLPWWIRAGPSSPMPRMFRIGGGGGARQLGLEDRFLHLGGAATTPLGGPAHTEVAALVELALPGAPQLDERILGGRRVAQLFTPGTMQVRAEPRAQLVLEGERLR